MKSLTPEQRAQLNANLDVIEQAEKEGREVGIITNGVPLDSRAREPFIEWSVSALATVEIKIQPREPRVKYFAESPAGTLHERASESASGSECADRPNWKIVRFVEVVEDSK